MTGVIGPIEERAGDWYDGLVSAIGSRVGDVPIDEDTVQEAVIRYWEQLAEGHSIRSAPAWVKTVESGIDPV